MSQGFRQSVAPRALGFGGCIPSAYAPVQIMPHLQCLESPLGILMRRLGPAGLKPSTCTTRDEGGNCALEVVFFCVVAEGAIADFQEFGGVSANAFGFFESYLQVVFFGAGEHSLKVDTFRREAVSAIHIAG